MAGTPQVIPPLTTDNPTPTPTGTGGSSPGGPATASGLYLYTFLATLLILLGISLAVILRATYRRRRMRIMIANGTYIPPNASTDFIGEFADDDDDGVALGPGAFGTGIGNGGWRAGGWNGNGGARGRGRGRRREKIWSVKPGLFDVTVVIEKDKGEKGASRWGDFVPISATLVASSPLPPNSNSNSQTPNLNPPQPSPIPISPPVDRRTRSRGGTSMFTRTLFSSYRTRASDSAQPPLAMDVMNTPNLPDTQLQSPTATATLPVAADRSIRVVFLVAMPSPTSPSHPTTKHNHKDAEDTDDESDSDEIEGERDSEKGEGDGEIPPMELGVVHLCLPPPALKTKTKAEENV